MLPLQLVAAGKKPPQKSSMPSLEDLLNRSADTISLDVAPSRAVSTFDMLAGVIPDSLPREFRPVGTDDAHAVARCAHQQHVLDLSLGASAGVAGGDATALQEHVGNLLLTVSLETM